MVIYEAFDVQDRALRVRHNRVGRDEAFLLEIETAGGTQTATLSVSEGLALGRTLVHRATAAAYGLAPVASPVGLERHNVG
jgi:hypothetical protein